MGKFGNISLIKTSNYLGFDLNKPSHRVVRFLYNEGKIEFTEIEEYTRIIQTLITE